MNPVFPSASRLGFGCASLGSRVAAAAGLKALRLAFDAGINWFDLAPSYGDGRAEEIFSDFVKGRRDSIHICTKCGIAPPPINRRAKLLRPVARMAIGLFPNLRDFAGRARPQAKRLCLSADLIRSSLDASLKKLRTDYVDVLALHDPDSTVFARADVARALEDILKSGKAKVIGVAGTPDDSLAALRAGLPIRHLQFADSPQQENLQRMRTNLGAESQRLNFVTHSVSGHGLPMRSPQAIHGLDRRWQEVLTGIDGSLSPTEVLYAAALRYALAVNPNGIVLLGMFSRRHLQFNLQCANDIPGTVNSADIARLFKDLAKTELLR